MASKPLRDRVTSSLPAQGVLQLHFLDHRTNYTCGRCQWHGQARTIATMDDNWRAPICRSCYTGLIQQRPG